LSQKRQFLRRFFLAKIFKKITASVPGHPVRGTPSQLNFSTRKKMAASPVLAPRSGQPDEFAKKIAQNAAKYIFLSEVNA
jgi:hypothetical protein